MAQTKFILPAIILAASLGVGTASLAPFPAAAQQAAPAPGAPPPMAGARPPAARRQLPPSMIEGRIAFVRAELKITAAQQPAFDRLADAMRQNDTERRQAFEQMRGNFRNDNAVQRMERMARLSQMRTEQANRVLTAFRPLYDSLSPAQKQAADHLFGRPFHGHFHGRPGFGPRR